MGPAISGDSWAAVNTPSSSRTAEASPELVPPNVLWLARWSRSNSPCSKAFCNAFRRAGSRVTVAPRDLRNRNSSDSSSADASADKPASQTGAPIGVSSTDLDPDAICKGYSTTLAVEAKPVTIMSRIESEPTPARVDSGVEPHARSCSDRNRERSVPPATVTALDRQPRRGRTASQPMSQGEGLGPERILLEFTGPRIVPVGLDQLPRDVGLIRRIIIVLTPRSQNVQLSS